jgi:uncharacterized membrane protein YphA (DoxX/SURF4 family)
MATSSTAAGPAALTPAGSAEQGALARVVSADPAYQSYLLLRIGFAVAPIAFGADKFANVMTHWTKYLASWVTDLLPGNAQQIMHAVGVVEIAAGILVLVKPRYGAYVVAAWLAGIIVNLLTYSGWYDVALRDFGLLLGALTLVRLASKYDPPLRLGRR